MANPKTREAKTEQELDRGGYKWKHETILISEIDYQASAENPARYHRRLNKDRATDYGILMCDGVIFPAIVVFYLENPHGGMKYIVVTGMHRLTGAMEVPLKEIDAYVVTEADTYRREALTRLINGIEGEGMTLHEKITQVLWLKDGYPSKTLTELAKSANLKINTVQNAWNEQKSHERARKYNVDLAKLKVPQKSSIALGTIRNEPAFKGAIQVINDVGVTGISSPEIKEMVSEVNKARDEKSQLDVVQRYRTAAEGKLQRAHVKTHPIKPAKINAVMGDLRRFNGHFDTPLPELHVPALAQPEQALVLLDVAEENIKRLKAEIKRCQRMGAPPPQPHIYPARPEARPS